MKRRILSVLLLITICTCTFSLTAHSDDANIISDDYAYHSTLFYDSSNPYNYVFGNSEYAYLCFIDTTFSGVDKLLFVHDGKIVRNKHTNTNLLKMYFAQNSERMYSYQHALQVAETIIDISGDLQFTAVVDEIGTLASTGLGALASAYLTGGGASLSLTTVRETLVKTSLETVKKQFIDLGNIISAVQLGVFHVSAATLKSYISDLTAVVNYNDFKNCEEFADTADKLTKTVAGTTVLMQEITANLDDSILEVLGGYVGDFAKGFIGSFADFIVSADSMAKLIETDSEYVAKIIMVATRLGEMQKTASLDDVGDAVEDLQIASDTSLCIIQAYKAYKNASTPTDALKTVNSVALLQNGTYDEADKNEFMNQNFSATVADGIYTVKNADSGLMLNVYAGINKDGTNVVTWEYDGTTDQQFYIKHIEDGKYAIFALCSANGNGGYTRCIDITVDEDNPKPSSGHNVDIYTRSSSSDDTQLFYIVPTEYGSYAFESCSSPYVVIGAAAPEKNNGNVLMQKWNNDISQTWDLCNTSGFIDSSAFENDYENTGEYNDDIIGVAMTQYGYIELNPTNGEPVFYTPDDLDSGIIKPFYTKYGNYFGNSSGQWCAYFVMWCAAEAGIPKSVLPQARQYGNCGSFVNWFKSNGRWRDADYLPNPGDIVFFHKDGKTTASHVGIVSEVHEDGSVSVIEGNTLNYNYYQVMEKTHYTNILGYGVLSADYPTAPNSYITEGGKTVGKAYMLPDTSAETVWYVDSGDKCITLCYDSDTDFYLLLYPFLSTGKYVAAYVPADIVGVYMEPYVPIPDAEDFYKLNKEVILTEGITLYHSDSTTALMNGSVDVRERATLSEGRVVRVLFEYHGYYFVTTSTKSGFVLKEEIDLNSIPSPDMPNPDLPTPDEPNPDEPTPDTPAVYPLGDVNLDGKLTDEDGTLILEYCAELSVFTEQQLSLADANGDGYINVADASFIFMLSNNTEG